LQPEQGGGSPPLPALDHFHPSIVKGRRIFTEVEIRQEEDQEEDMD
jgi:hypothetical protein